VPYNVALVVVGLLLVVFNIVPGTPMDPEVVLLVFLPIPIFQGALSADAASLRQAAKPILALAIPGVAVSLLATAAIAAWEIGLPFPVALLLGAVAYRNFKRHFTSSTALYAPRGASSIR